METVTGKQNENVFVISCAGYLNMEVGDEISKLCTREIDNGVTSFLINLETVSTNCALMKVP